ncbi:hypothetical protein [Rhizobium phage RHph_X2_24]|nr:hypothetical protein [Rhizobium phage RHph_X2_24]
MPAVVSLEQMIKEYDTADYHRVKRILELSIRVNHASSIANAEKRLQELRNRWPELET